MRERGASWFSRRCAASSGDGADAPPHHEGLASLRTRGPRPEERACARLEGGATTGMVTRSLALAAHGVRVFPSIPPSSRTEGAGKTGCPSHPWSACNKKARGRTTGTSRNARPSLRNGFNGFLRALPGETGLCCHRPCDAGSVVTSATMRKRIARGAPASGRQDHTTSPSARAKVVCRRPHVHHSPHQRIVTTRTPLA
jgi:hypothetical protein